MPANFIPVPRDEDLTLSKRLTKIVGETIQHSGRHYKLRIVEVGRSIWVF